MLFVIAFDVPISQGNTTYPFVITEFKEKRTETIKIKLSADQREKLYNNSLKEVYEGYLYNTVAQLFKLIIGVNIIIPGDFQSFSLS